MIRGIFGILKDGGLLIDLYIVASKNCFKYRSIFQNGVDTLSALNEGQVEVTTLGKKSDHNQWSGHNAVLGSNVKQG